jgi:hypothetical protein
MFSKLSHSISSYLSRADFSCPLEKNSGWKEEDLKIRKTLKYRNNHISDIVSKNIMGQSNFVWHFKEFIMKNVERYA